MGSAGAGPVCDSTKCTDTTLPDSISHDGSSGDGCPPVPVAQRASLCLSTLEPASPVAQADLSSEGGGSVGGPILATASVVPGCSSDLPGTGLAVASAGRSLKSGSNSTPKSRHVPTDCLEVERQALNKKGYPSRVIDTLLASKKASTNRSYNNTWKTFRAWCIDKGVSPLFCTTNNFLQFLQAGLDKGLSTSTLRRQVAALRSVLRDAKVHSALCHPDVTRFLRAVKLKNPPVVHRFPSWDLHLVLAALEKSPFEPLASVELKILTFKTIFLVAITSARRVSELGALSINPNLCVFQADRVILRVDPSFVPKVNSWFHRAQDLVVPSFCPNPSTNLEQDWHKLDVKRALRYYIDRTKTIRKTDSLFVHFQGKSVGLRPSNPSLARWMVGAIVLAYRSIGKIPPAGITAHSLRSAAASAAFEGYASLDSICKAATWSNPSTFTKHYKIDQAASAEAAFGRRVLQKVVET